jgi:trans-2,3-dihydro-3-hydroxyanthranilate isomerase
MSRVPFYFVDVFAVTPLTGNPVAVVPDADALTDAQMRAIAREFNQSETAFVVAPGRPGATVRLRSFTPIGAEVFGAGHNALGCWLWLALAGRLPAAAADSGLAQQIGDDVLPVRVRREPDGAVVVSMDQSPPQFGNIAADRGALAAALGLAEDDLVPCDPAQVVATGAGHPLVSLRDRAAVDRAVPHPAELAAELAASSAGPAASRSGRPARRSRSAAPA